jgi:sugar/nucleoside kinase (ribokinase family)
MTPTAFLSAAHGAGTLFANEDEALALSGATDVVLAIDRLSAGFDEVVVTLGDKGARARRAGVDYFMPSASDEVIDTTGAGDAATGAYLAVRLKEGTIDEALAAAMSAASVVVRGLGSRG